MSKQVVVHPEWEVTEMESIPVNANPFLYDSLHMGTKVEDVTVMFSRFADELHCIGERSDPVEIIGNEYIIIIHEPTGKRIRLQLPRS